MNINEIKAAVDAARERQAKEIQDCPFCGNGQFMHNEHGEMQCFSCSAVEGVGDGNWNNRPAQEQSDNALIALWEMMRPKETPEPFRNCIVRVVDGEIKMFFTDEKEEGDA